MGDFLIERPSEAALLRLALRRIAEPAGSTKGMGPKDQAQRLRADLESRIRIARDALTHPETSPLLPRGGG